MVLQKLFQPMKKKPDLTDSVIEWQQLIRSQLLRGKKLKDNKRQIKTRHVKCINDGE